MAVRVRWKCDWRGSTAESCSSETLPPQWESRIDPSVLGLLVRPKTHHFCASGCGRLWESAVNGAIREARTAFLKAVRTRRVEARSAVDSLADIAKHESHMYEASLVQYPWNASLGVE